MDFDVRNLTTEDLMELDIDQLKQLKGLMVKSREANQSLIDNDKKQKIKQDMKQELAEGNTSASLAAIKGGLQELLLGCR